MPQGSTKDVIIRTAVTLFAQKGFTETNIREIARAVGIRESSIYNHFHSKLDILLEILSIYTTLCKQNAFRKVNISVFFDESIPLENAMQSILFTRFPDDDAEFYLKILHILMHEQFREEHVRDFMTQVFFQYQTKFIAGILSDLVETQAIEPLDVDFVAKSHVCVLYTFAATTMMGCSDYSPEFKGHTMDEMLLVLYRTSLKRYQPPKTRSKRTKAAGGNS